jgi:hypothetical protein
MLAAILRASSRVSHFMALRRVDLLRKDRTGEAALSHASAPKVLAERASG